MRRRPRTNKNYLSALISDPIVRGKDINHDTHCHAVPYQFQFFRALFFWGINVIGLMVMLAGFIHLAINYNIQGITYAIYGVVIFLFTYVISFLARKAVRCPLCKAHCLVDGKSYKHEKAFKIKPLSFNATTCTSIIIKGKFRCMHCGTPFDLTKRKNKTL